MNRAQHMEEVPTTPAVNILQFAPTLLDGMADKRIALHWLQGKTPCVAWLKSKFGRQTFCWTGEYRFWVWELYEQHVRVFASDIQGWSFEVKEGLSPRETRDLWDRFVTDLEATR